MSISWQFCPVVIRAGQFQQVGNFNNSTELYQTSHYRALFYLIGTAQPL